MATRHMETRAYMQYAIQRPISGGDINEFLKTVRSYDIDVKPRVLQDIILFDFPHTEHGIKCMRVNCRNSLCCLVDDNALTEDGMFLSDVEAVCWKPMPHVALYDHSNKLYVTLQWTTDASVNAFTPHEKWAIDKFMVSCLGTAPNVIMNRSIMGTVNIYNDSRTKLLSRTQIRATDLPGDIDIYLGYSLKDALDTWTIPSEDYPDSIEDRSFKCWRCSQRSTWTNFGFGDDDDTFISILESHVQGEVPCCTECRSTLIYSNDMDLCRN